jgi:hypothetical protein
MGLLRGYRWLVAALAVGLAILPLPPGPVERWYSTGVYQVLQPGLTRASNTVPFALLDILLTVSLAALVLLAVRDGRACGWRRAILQSAARLVLVAAIGYLIFLASWGLNYRRVKLEARVPFDESAITSEAALRLATTTVDRLNALYAPAHAQGWMTGSAIDTVLASAFNRAVRDVGVPRDVVVGRPKRSILDWYFQRAGVSGMTDPIFLETLVASDLLPFERPFVIAHEWSHLAGLADEGEANLAGWLSCIRGAERDAYSGWLFMYGEALRAVIASERAALVAKLGDGPRRDLRAIRERIAQHVEPRVSAAGWRVYDSYLKANRVEAGAASYEQVVRLALGLRGTEIR